MSPPRRPRVEGTHKRRRNVTFRAILVARARFTGLQDPDARLAGPPALLGRAGLALHVTVGTNIRERCQELPPARLALLLLVDLDDDAIYSGQGIVGLLPILDAAPFRQLLAVAVREIEVDLVLYRIKGLLQLIKEVTILADNNELRRHVGVLQSTDLARDGTELCLLYTSPSPRD